MSDEEPESLIPSEYELNQLRDKINEVGEAFNRISQKYREICRDLKDFKENDESICLKSPCDYENDLETKWIKQKFEWSEKIQNFLIQKFKLETFRSKQLAAINATLSKKDCLVVMPTGSGKSLIYQLSALFDKGFTLVVSPLLSLIQDQLVHLKEMGITAVTINSGNKASAKEVYNQMINKNSDLKLVYVTPEWLSKSKKFVSHLQKCYEAGLVSRVAIDEVHCCSTWGHDFRPEYGKLGLLRAVIPDVPYIGLTATATKKVIKDVEEFLDLKKGYVMVRDSFNRSNLNYKVINKPSTKESVLEYLEKLLKNDYNNQSGIIYTTSVNESINLATDLKNKKIKAAPYNSSLDTVTKDRIHQKWLDKEYQVIVATIAFGMGINKGDVRFVIHHCIPRSIEYLYQETGRAGRDGQPADCIIMFSLNDYFKVLGMANTVTDEKKAQDVLEYCLDPDTCRRELIAEHFEEEYHNNMCNKMCDHCIQGDIDVEMYNISQICRDIHKMIDNADKQQEKLTLNKLIECWYSTGPKKLRVSTIQIPKIRKTLAEYVISCLLLKKYLAIDKQYTPYTTYYYIKKGNNVNGPIVLRTSYKLIGFPKYLCKNDGFSEKRSKTE